MKESSLQFIDRSVQRIGGSLDKILELLHAVQEHFGYLPAEALERIVQTTEIRPWSLAGVSSFYDYFRFEPSGRHLIRVCVGTACHVKGGQRVLEEFKRYLGIAEDGDTDTDRRFTVMPVACLGCCTLAPAVQIDQVTYGQVKPDKVPSVITDFLRHEQLCRSNATGKSRTRPAKGVPAGEIRLCLDSCCVARGSGKLNLALENILAQTGISAAVKPVSCVGMCHQTPLLEIVMPDGGSHMYSGINPRDARSVLLGHFAPGGLWNRIRNAGLRLLETLLAPGDTVPAGGYALDVREKPVADFLGKQKHIITEHWGRLDPVDIDEYIVLDGFQALERVVKNPNGDRIISEIEKSGLRGRGGAGYPSHLKWSAVRQSDSGIKYIVCNGDEGDPGAFMDRMIMESYPYRVIEGMAIAALAVGAREGFIYIRAEYPFATERVRHAIDQCYRRGLLGDRIFESDFSLRLKTVPGAGAFVCGEETALISSIEGHRGMPRLRPPYPAEKGLWGKPTLINNVETFAAIPWILRNGAESFACLGTGRSRGTKVFALAGKIKRGGLIEVPMGITIREVIEDIGGGIAEGKSLKAVQIGGPSGGCIPHWLTDTSIDYETLASMGAIMGSGGLVVLDESDCMVDMARYFLQFTQNQSCGKCTFCRIGTRRMLDILTGLCQGKGRKKDLEALEQLAMMIKKASLCGLGKTAPNPVLSTIRYFRGEYEAHLEGRCPAGRCRALIEYTITDDCIGCTLCAQNCPAGAIAIKPYEKHQIDREKCIRCDICRGICPAGAVNVE